MVCLTKTFVGNEQPLALVFMVSFNTVSYEMLCYFRMHSIIYLKLQSKYWHLYGSVQP